MKFNVLHFLIICLTKLLLIFLWSISPVSSAVGTACRSNSNCDSNEVCDSITKKCVCGPCHGLNAAGTTCIDLAFRATCDTSSSPDCSDACSGAGNEIYPEHAFCDTGSKRVRCSSCYSAANRTCVLNKPIKAYAGTCQSDCDCGFGLKCSAHCSCPAGFKWNNETLKCEKVEFDGACKNDMDCNSYGFSGRKNGFTYRGGRCSATTKRCECAPGYVVTQTNFIDRENGGFRYSKRLCVVSGTAVNLGSNQTCDLDPVFMSDSTAGAVCGGEFVCHTCPEDRIPGRGRCRLYNRTEIFSRDKCLLSVPPSTSARTTTTTQAPIVGTSKRNQLCTADSQCGVNEICYQPPVEPPCQFGRCVCKDCYSPNENGLCAPNIFLLHGDRCNGAENELYQANAECVKTMVRCQRGYKLNTTTSNNRNYTTCVPDSYNYVGHGAKCELPRLQCLGDLQCSSLTCDCPLTNQKYDSEDGKCIVRSRGDTCSHDIDCDENSNRQNFPSGRVCRNSNCTCDRDFVASPTLAGSSVFNPGKCENSSYSKVGTLTGTGPSSGLLRNGQTDAGYFDLEYLKTIMKCPIFNDVLASIVEQKVTDVNEIDDQTSKTPMSRYAAKLGQICNVDDDCGLNEECSGETDPPCGNKTCVCKPCYGQSPNGTCQFVVVKRMGEPCTGLGQEMYATKNATCVDGLVGCQDCFNQTDQLCVPIPGSLFGSRCTKNCECSQEAGLQCNTYIGFCDCPDLNYRWNIDQRRCELRDPNRRRSATRCSRDEDCTLLEDRADKCDLATRRCMCSQVADIFDEMESKCVPRPFGHRCVTNDHCSGIYLEHGLARTAQEGVCSANSTCSCAPNITVVDASFIRKTPNVPDRRFDKQICLAPQAKDRLTQVPSGGKCSIKPFDDFEKALAVAGTYDSKGLICASGATCMKCPEDFDSPKCRVPRRRMNPSAEVCERFERALKQTTPRPGGSVSRIGEYCSANEDCGPLEDCTWTNVTRAMRPRCGSVGICICKQGFVATEVPSSASNLPGAKARYCAALPESSATPPRHREYRENCVRDQDCQTFPENNLAGFAYGGGVCTDGVCDCSTDYKAYTLGYLADNGATLRQKTICVHKLANTQVAASERCTTAAVLFSDSPKLRLCLQPKSDGSATENSRVVAVCYRCPFDVAGDSGGTNPIKFDGFTPQDGVCRLVALP